MVKYRRKQYVVLTYASVHQIPIEDAEIRDTQDDEQTKMGARSAPLEIRDLPYKEIMETL